MLISFLRKSRLSLPITPGKKKKKRGKKSIVLFYLFIWQGLCRYNVVEFGDERSTKLMF
jgi:hypothetical protein